MENNGNTHPKLASKPHQGNAQQDDKATHYTGSGDDARTDPHPRERNAVGTTVQRNAEVLEG